MNIEIENVDNLNKIIKIRVEKSDYIEKAEKELANYRRKASIPGFRPGKAPVGFVKKLAWLPIVAEEVNKIVSDNLYKAIEENKLDIIGEPIPATGYKPVDFEKDENYDFHFEIGLKPEFDILSGLKGTHIYYRLKVEESHIDSTVESHTRRYGKSIDAQTIEENDLLRGNIEQVDENGQPIEGQYKAGPSLIAISNIKDDEIRKQFLQAKINDRILFSMENAFNGKEAAYILGIKPKDEDETITGRFAFTIQSISRFIPAEVNQELFDKVYGQGTVTSVEQYRQRIKEEIAQTFEKETDFKFFIDVRKKLIENLNLSLPDEFMKKWLRFSSKDLTDDIIEKEYPAFRDDLIWQIIRNKITAENQIDVTEQEMTDYARQATISQFANYGLYNLPEENIASFAAEILKKPEEKRKISSKIIENKLIAYFKSNVKMKEKEVSIEEFGKIINE